MPPGLGTAIGHPPPANLWTASRYWRPSGRLPSNLWAVNREDFGCPSGFGGAGPGWGSSMLLILVLAIPWVSLESSNHHGGGRCGGASRSRSEVQEHAHRNSVHRHTALGERVISHVRGYVKMSEWERSERRETPEGLPTSQGHEPSILRRSSNSHQSHQAGFGSSVCAVNLWV